jgi:hypothetical protein
LAKDAHGNFSIFDLNLAFSFATVGEGHLRKRSVLAKKGVNNSQF